MGNKTTTFLIIGVLALLTAANSFYILTEGQQAIVTQFGKPVGEGTTEAGLHFKLPFIQKVRYVDKRILSWDGSPNQIPTRDKKYIRVDTTARWKIVDALKFIQTVQNELGAKARIDTILDGHTRDVISNNNLVEAVRNSNQILDNLEAKKALVQKKKKKGDVADAAVIAAEEEVSTDIEKIRLGREKLSDLIVEKADSELRALGIDLIDLQLRRISYEKSVEEKVYDRMISERQRVAQKIRSIGKGEKAEIEGRTAKDLNRIQSEAYKKAQLVRGKAQAKATAIYAKSLKKAPEFYEFIRTLEAYDKAIKKDSKFILSSDSEFLKLLR